MLGLVGLLNGQLAQVRALGGAALAAQAEGALWGLGALTLGALGLSLRAIGRYYSFKHRSLHDALTQTPNRQHFLHVLGRWAKRAHSEGRHLSLVLVDIDFFKHYNDRNGHLSGDRALHQLAGLLQGALRVGDTVARYGGEEFTVLLPDTNEAEALATARRLCRVVREASFEHGEEQPRRRFTVSAGVASLEPGLSPEGLIARADQAMYQAKRSGRDQAVLWSVREKLAVAANVDKQMRHGGPRLEGAL